MEVKFKQPRPLIIFFKELKRGLSNLVRWFKIVWFDRDWDYHYLYYAMKFKLERMISYFEKHGHAVNAWYEIKYMRIAVSLLDELSNEKYEDIGEPSIDDWMNDEEYCNRLRESFNKSAIRQQKCVRLLGLIIEKRSMGWWD